MTLSAVEPFLGERHICRTIYNGAVRGLNISQSAEPIFEMARMQNGGSWTESADRAFLTCVEMMMLTLQKSVKPDQHLRSNGTGLESS
jgi:hypothetical protein